MFFKRHEIYKNQYRAFNVENCKINQNKTMQPQNMEKNKKNKEENEEFELFFSVECESCSTEIGVYEFNKKTYHFFNVLTGF